MLPPLATSLFVEPSHTQHTLIRMSSTTTSENLSLTVSEVRITVDGESTSSTSNDPTGHITFTLFDRNILILLCMFCVFVVVVSLLGMVLAGLVHTPPQLVKFWDNRLLEVFQINQISI